MTTYSQFLAGKRRLAPDAGIDVPASAMNPGLFDFQADITRWALRKGKAAIFAGTGLGKSLMQLEFGRHVYAHTAMDVLILAPLAVAEQTRREGEKFGISVTHCREQSDVRPGINITNYERLHLFDPSRFGCIILDESSILKSYNGATRTAIIEAFAMTPFRLACTATPAPNDYMELGNHAEFMGVMSRTEMLAMYFVHDGGETQVWRLKGHAEDDFWRWVCSWAVMLQHPRDLGYDADQFDLPPLTMHEHSVDSVAPEGMLFAVEAQTLIERRQARRASMDERVRLCADLVNATDDPWIVWCDLNAEGDALTKAIPGAVQITGADDAAVKESRMLGFTDGAFRVLVTKPSIAGHGMNWQHCANVAFVGLSDSWEAYYQAIRRCWRFGQTRPVACHVIASEAEGAVVANIQRKERDAERMQREMVTHMADLNSAALRATERETDTYEPVQPMMLPAWFAGAA